MKNDNVFLEFQKDRRVGHLSEELSRSARVLLNCLNSSDYTGVTNETAPWC